nr:putative polyketide hydroxylase isoform X1 [Ipomoea batatas]
MAQSASLLLLGLAGRKAQGISTFPIQESLLCPSNNHTQQRALSNSHSINGEDPIFPVLIIGAGLVGLALSILLTNLGVKCAVLEKSKVFSTHPQAHFINNRLMEVFRIMDGLAEEILSSQPPVEFWRKFIYCTSLTGPILGSVDHMQHEDFDHIVSPVSVAHFSQYKLTRLMLKQLKELDFHIRNYEGFGMNDGFISEKQLLMGHECTAINPSNHFITVTTSFPGEGKSSEESIRCQFLVGTDGAATHNLEQGEFVLQIPFYPPQQRLEDFSSEMHKIIYDLVGKELADIKVIDIKPWVMHVEVAEKFLSCGNRIILAGDVAHHFPPAGGFGMNTGIQDAHNIAWKLALVSKAIAPASFLSTYEAEHASERSGSDESKSKSSSSSSSSISEEDTRRKRRRH